MDVSVTFFVIVFAFLHMTNGGVRDFDFEKKEFVVVETERGKRDVNPFYNSAEENEVDVDENVDVEAPKLRPQIYSFHIFSDIRYRYARTLVTSRVVNNNTNASAEVTFQMVLPAAAFISKFLIEIDGKTYEAYVKEKDEARRVYNEARDQGLSAGLVEVNARHANVFNVNINVKALTKVTFNLTYEEFLMRKLSRYEHAINIMQEKFSEIRDFKITVSIQESQNITLLSVPSLRPDTEVAFDAQEAQNADAVIHRGSGNSAMITWTPSAVDLWKWNGILGKFIVQYDISRESEAGEILVMNGYFVHFYAPKSILPLRKHVVYVLDISGSMSGRKMTQLKDVMGIVMDDLKPDDFFNIVTFSSKSKIWHYTKEKGGRPEPLIASEFALRQAHHFIQGLQAIGGTNIDSALSDALDVTSRVKGTAEQRNHTLPPNVESLILFLTDGEPSTGVTRLDLILSNAKERNVGKVPIYTVALGDSADFNFLKQLALQNHGFGRKIYEGGDADIQIRGFYKEISSPLLSNITFKYTTNSSRRRVTKITKQKFPNIFLGSEIAVAGCFKRESKGSPPSYQDRGGQNDLPNIAVNIDANGRDGHVCVRGENITDVRYVYSLTSPISTTEPPRNENALGDLEDEFLERLWAYITIKQLLEENPTHHEATDYVYEDFGEEVIEEGSEDDILPPIPITSLRSNESAKDRALRLALKYGFVTPITSLVVVKPNETSTSPNESGRGTEEAVDLKEAKTTPHVPQMLPPRRPASPSRSRAGSAISSSSVSKSARRNLMTDSSMILHASPMMAADSRVNLFDLPFPSQFLSAQDSAQRQSIDWIRTGATKISGVVTANARRSGWRGLSRHTTAPTTRRPSYGLEDINWTQQDGKGVFLMAYGLKIDVSQDGVERIKNESCTGGSRHNRFVGKCKHLSDCGNRAFTQSYLKYLDEYFCIANPEDGEVGGRLFAGVCCSPK